MFFLLVPPRKILNMELVPPTESTLVPPMKEFLATEKKLIFCVLGGTNEVSHYSVGEGPVPYLELFWLGPVKKHPV